MTIRPDTPALATTRLDEGLVRRLLLTRLRERLAVTMPAVRVLLPGDQEPGHDTALDAWCRLVRLDLSPEPRAHRADADRRRLVGVFNAAARLDATATNAFALDRVLAAVAEALTLREGLRPPASASAAELEHSIRLHEPEVILDDDTDPQALFAGGAVRVTGTAERRTGNARTAATT